MRSKIFSLANDAVFRKLGLYICASLLLVVIWIIISNTLELTVTHWHYLRNDVPESWKLSLFGFLLLVFAAALTRLQKWIDGVSPLVLSLFLGAFILTLVAQQKYRAYYSNLEKQPKIQYITRNWSIQGDRLVIKGRNFGDPWRLGSVWLNDIEYTIVSWDDERIVIEQPVTEQFTSGTLVIKNEAGNVVEVSEFEIKDPTEVLESL